MYAIERKPPLQPAPETVFKSTFQMAKYHRDRVPLASEGIRNCGVHSGDVEKAGRNSDILLRRGFTLSYTYSQACRLSSGAPLSHLLDTPLLLLAGVLTGLLLFL